MDYFSTAAADNFRLARSKVILSPEDGTYGAIRLPHKAYVMDVQVNIVTPFSSGSTGTLDIGVSGSIDDDDFFITSAHAAPDTAGFTRASSGTAVGAEGCWLSAGPGAITFTVDKGDSADDIEFCIYVVYSIIY